jgi:hypothetical protein
LEALIEYYQNQGFQVISPDGYSQFALAPDYLFEKGSTIHAVIIRSTGSLSISLIQRFSTSKRIPSKTLELYFYFPQKPSATILKGCKLLSVGILYLNTKSGIDIYAESKIIKGRQKVPSLPRTQIFFCSRQSLEERQLAESLVEDQRESLKVPIFPMLVENDQEYSNDIRDLWPIIEKCMDACEYVLVILSGQHREIIEKEARRALERYDPSELLFYVKSDKETIEAYQQLLKDASDHGVKFTEYFDLRKFKQLFNLRLLKIIKQLHDDNQVPFLEGL